MNIERLQAAFSLVADALPQGAQVGGRNPIGIDFKTILQGVDYPNLVAYGGRITADANGDVATLTHSTGAVAQTTGTPIIAGFGTDFEGGALGLGTSSIVVGLVATAAAGNTDEITLTSDGLDHSPSVILPPGGAISAFYKVDNAGVGAATLAATFPEAGDIIDLAIFALTS